MRIFLSAMIVFFSSLIELIQGIITTNKPCNQGDLSILIYDMCHAHRNVQLELNYPGDASPHNIFYKRKSGSG